MMAYLLPAETRLDDSVEGIATQFDQRLRKVWTDEMQS